MTPGARRQGPGVSTAAPVTPAPGRAGPGHLARTEVSHVRVIKIIMIVMIVRIIRTLY